MNLLQQLWQGLMGGAAYSQSHTCSLCGATYDPMNQSHTCPTLTQTQAAQNSAWQFHGGTNLTNIGITPQPYIPPKPSPLWQKHKREPKWHLYLGGGALCDGDTSVFQAKPASGIAWGTNVVLSTSSALYPWSVLPTNNKEYLSWPADNTSPPEEEKCGDCIAEYAALKLQDKVE